MLPSGSWLHTTVGFIVGVISTIFAIAIPSQLKKSGSTKRLIGALVLYSFSTALVYFFYAAALSGGLLIEWKLLGFPELGDPAVKILDLGYIQAKSGNIYHDREGKWERVDVVAQNEKAYRIISSTSNCGTLSFLPMLEEDIVDSKSACVAWGAGIAKVAYAIDSGGRVYSWWHGVGEFGGIEKIIFPISGAINSCVFGVFVIAVVVLLNFIKDRRRKSNPTEQSSAE